MPSGLTRILRSAPGLLSDLRGFTDAVSNAGWASIASRKAKGMRNFFMTVYPFSPRSVCGGFLHAVNDDDFDRAFCGFEFESELLLERGENRRTGGLGRASFLGLQAGAARSLHAGGSRILGPLHLEIVTALEARPIQHDTTEHSRQVGCQQLHRCPLCDQFAAVPLHTLTLAG